MSVFQPASWGIQPERARATWLALGFLLDVADLSSDGDLLEAVISAAIIQANQVSLAHEPSVRSAYAHSGDALPDDLRRSISVHAIAGSLRLPFETVRRRVKRLIEKGRCVSTEAGVYVPRSVILSDSHGRVQSARLARMNRLHDDLLRADVLRADEALPIALPDDLKRPANRILSDYMLRSTDRLADLVGDVQHALVLLGLCERNVAELAAAAVTASDGGQPRPCSSRAVSLRLALPYESVRRRLGELEAAGFAHREDGGWMAAAPPKEADRVVRLVEDQEGELRRLFARLKDLLVAQISH